MVGWEERKEGSSAVVGTAAAAPEGATAEATEAATAEAPAEVETAAEAPAEVETAAAAPEGATAKATEGSQEAICCQCRAVPIREARSRWDRRDTRTIHR